jgi:membrane fusion protein (multidrug efflux system)
MPPEDSEKVVDTPTHADKATTPASLPTEAAKELTPPAAPIAASGPAAPVARPINKRRLWLIGGAILLLIVGRYFVVPIVWRALNTVSTDDAYVNGHATFVATRVPGQVMKVLVDDNNRVAKGDLLVQLDKEPNQVQRDLKQAFVEVAQADFLAAEDSVRGYAAQARSNRYKLQHAIELVDDQIAQLRAAVAAYESQKATLALAQANLARGEKLVTTGAMSKEEFDQRVQQSKVSEAQVRQALEQVYEIRVGLGLPTQPASGNLTETPPDLNQNFSTVRQALADLLESAAPLGIYPTSYDLSPKATIEEFYKRDPEGNLDRIYAKLIRDAPLIKQARAKVLQAQRDLAQAELNLRYCDVFAEIDGVVTRRNVNPGNNVQAGQALMVVRSLTEIWIDANFKETQLANLRIGQRVELDVDMYGSRHMFPARITGFTMGTGSTLSLLPAQNATGNFIKVVQRLPVRIELTDYDPDKQPLFTGLSVIPYVFFKDPATGPDAGKLLQPLVMTAPAASKSAGATGAKP